MCNSLRVYENVVQRLNFGIQEASIDSFLLCSNVASVTNACIAAHEITCSLSKQCQNTYRLIDRFFRAFIPVKFHKYMEAIDPSLRRKFVP